MYTCNIQSGTSMYVFILLAVLEVTQRVQPTGTINNIQSDTSMYVRIVVGTGSDTPSTTNRYHQQVQQRRTFRLVLHGLRVERPCGQPGRQCVRYLKISKIEKMLVLIILVIVFKHKIKLKKYMFV